MLRPLLLLALLQASTVAWTAPVALTVRDAAGRPVPGAVVYLEGGERGAVRSVTTAVVDQRNKSFVPAVSVIQAGTDVRFTNSDPVSHHVYSFAAPNTFELPLYKGDSQPAVRLAQPGLVTLGCNIHDAMLGWIVVVDTPYFGKTGDDGVLVLADVPAGQYQARVWSPRLDPARVLAAGPVSVAGAEASQALTLDRRLRPAPAAGGLVESGY